MNGVEGEKSDCRKQEISDILGEQVSQRRAVSAGTSVRAVRPSGPQRKKYVSEEKEGRASSPAEILVGGEVKR